MTMSHKRMQQVFHYNQTRAQEMFATLIAWAIHVSTDQHWMSGTGFSTYMQYMQDDGSVSQWTTLYQDQDVWEDMENIPKAPTGDKPSAKHYANSVSWTMLG